MSGQVYDAYYGEGDAEAVDKEWEEFAKLVDIRNKRRDQQNTFYPCPAPEEDYESTIVRFRIFFLCFAVHKV